METVGIYLKKEREAKSISLGEVARLTKISEFYLNYIERDEFEKLPQGPYIKGYISSYSEQIGSDVDEALKRFDALNENKNVTEVVVPTDWEKEKKNVLPENCQNRNWKRTAHTPSINKRFPIWRAVLFGVAAILSIGLCMLAGFGFYHLFLFEKEPSATTKKMPLPVQKEVDALEPVVHDSEPKKVAKIPTAQTANVQWESATDTVDAPADPLPGNPSDRTVAVEPEPPVENKPSPAFVKSSVVAEKIPEVSAPLKVLRATVCSQIKDRMPSGIATVYPSSAQRVYVWSQIQAEQIPTEIRHIYYFNDRKISDVTLKVRSAFWRTWSYKSMSGDQHRGRWRVDIATANGTILQQLDFVIN